jgi:hypothetical protein
MPPSASSEAVVFDATSTASRSPDWPPSERYWALVPVSKSTVLPSGRNAGQPTNCGLPVTTSTRPENVFVAVSKSITERVWPESTA